MAAPATPRASISGTCAWTNWKIKTTAAPIMTIIPSAVSPFD